MLDELNEYREMLDDIYEATKKMAWGSAITKDAVNIARKILKICIIQEQMIESLYEQIETERRLP